MRRKKAEAFCELSLLCREKELVCTAALYPTAPFDDIDETILDAAELVALQTYIWDDAEHATPAAPIDELIAVLDHSVSKKYHKKILLGIPTFGIDYAEHGNQYQKRIIDPTAWHVAIGARRIAVSFDDRTQTPYFCYTETPHSDSPKHTAHFEDARSYLRKLDLVESYNLGGVSVYSLEHGAPSFWQVLTRKFGIVKY